MNAIQRARLLFLRVGRPNLSVTITAPNQDMKKGPTVPLTYVLVALICFAVAGAIVFLIHRKPGAINLGTGTAGVRSQRTSTQMLTFKSVAILDGKTERGISFSNQIYQSSDCVTVSLRIETLNSPANAHLELERNLSRAQQILEREPKLNSLGQQIGERIKLALTRDSQQERYAVLWTDKSELYSLESSSLKHVEDFERWQAVPNAEREGTAPGSNSSQEITFEGASPFSGRTQEGIPFREQQFKSTECITMIDRIEYLDSPAAAKAQFQIRIKRAAQTIESGAKLDANGKIVGERAVVMFAPDLPHELQHRAAIIWTQDAELHSVSALSLRHVLEFEKKHHH